MNIVSGTLHLFSGKQIELATKAAVEVVTSFWSSVPDHDDIPTTLELSPTHHIVVTRSSIAAIELVGRPER